MDQWEIVFSCIPPLIVFPYFTSIHFFTYKTMYVKGIAIFMKVIIPINIKNKNNSTNNKNWPVEVFFLNLLINEKLS